MCDPLWTGCLSSRGARWISFKKAAPEDRILLAGGPWKAQEKMHCTNKIPCLHAIPQYSICLSWYLGKVFLKGKDCFILFYFSRPDGSQTFCGTASWTGCRHFCWRKLLSKWHETMDVVNAAMSMLFGKHLECNKKSLFTVHITNKSRNGHMPASSGQPSLGMAGGHLNGTQGVLLATTCHHTP